MEKIKKFIISLAGYGKSGGKGLGKAVTSRQAQFGSNALISLIVFAGILILINLIVRNQGWRWDLTKNKIYTFTPESTRVVKGIRNDVKIYVFFASNSLTAENRNLIKEYDSRSSKISTEYIDLYKDAQLALRYGVQRVNTLVFVSGDKVEITPNITESDITSALIRLDNSEKVQVTFWSANGEKNPDESGQSGLSQLKNDLEKLNYTVVKQNSYNDSQVATGTGVLVLAGPTNPYSNKQKDMLDKYLAEGGRAMILMDPTQDNKNFNIEDVLSKYGIEIDHGIVVETDPQRFYNSPINPGTDSYSQHKITENLEVTIFFLAQQVKQAANIPENAEVKRLMETTAGSYLIKGAISGNTLPPKAANDPSGPLSLGVAMKFNPSKEQEKENKYKTRLVVIGDSDFASNILTTPNQADGLFASGNIDLLVNSINWLSDRYSINAAPKDRTQPTLTLNDGQKRQLQYLTIGVMPGLALLSGLVVWRLRRRSRMNKK